MRNTAAKASADEDVMKANADLSKGISKLFALAEAYPDLKARYKLHRIAGAVGSCRKDIANAKESNYNGCVKKILIIH